MPVNLVQITVYQAECDKCHVKREFLACDITSACMVAESVADWEWTIEGGHTILHCNECKCWYDLSGKIRKGLSKEDQFKAEVLLTEEGQIAIKQVQEARMKATNARSKRSSKSS